MEKFLGQIKKIRDEFGLDQKAFSRKINKKGDIISRWKSGEAKNVKIETLLIIRDKFNKSLDWLLFGEEPTAPQLLQPIITIVGQYPDVSLDVRTEDYLAVPMVEGYIAAGYEGIIPEEYIINFVWVYRPEIGKRQYHNLRAVRLGKQAESMRHTLKPGDIIIIDPTEKPPAKLLVQKGIYAIRVDEEGGCAVKRVREKDDFWILLSDNPEYDPILIKKDAKYNPIIGRVIWSWTSWV